MLLTSTCPKSAFERLTQWFDTMSTSLIADSGHLASDAISKEFVCFTRFASYHRDLLRVLVRSLSHVPGRCSTSFTNNLDHITTFSYLDSFYRLDLCLPKGGISKSVVTHPCRRFRLVDNFGQTQTNLLVSFASWKEIWKVYIKEICSDSRVRKIIAVWSNHASVCCTAVRLIS